MTFDNEHAAQQEDPKRFTTFTRKNPSGFPKGIDLVFARSPGTAQEIQSVRFDANRFSEKEAKTFLSDRGFKTSAFDMSELKKKKTWSRDIQISKTDDDQQLVFGWLYTSVDKHGGQVVDHSGEVIDVEDLETAMYGFVLKSRNGKVMHRGENTATLVESMVFTPSKKKAMGIPEGVLPDGAWVGFKVHDSDAWDKVKSGELSMFSLGGTARHEEL